MASTIEAAVLLDVKCGNCKGSLDAEFWPSTSYRGIGSVIVSKCKNCIADAIADATHDHDDEVDDLENQINDLENQIGELKSAAARALANPKTQKKKCNALPLRRS